MRAPSLVHQDLTDYFLKARHVWKLIQAMSTPHFKATTGLHWGGSLNRALSSDHSKARPMLPRPLWFCSLSLAMTSAVLEVTSDPGQRQSNNPQKYTQKGSGDRAWESGPSWVPRMLVVLRQGRFLLSASFQKTGRNLTADLPLPQRCPKTSWVINTLQGQSELLHSKLLKNSTTRANKILI